MNRAILITLLAACGDDGPTKADLNAKYTCTSNWPGAPVGGQCVAACEDYTALRDGSTCIPDAPETDITHGGGMYPCTMGGVVEFDGVRVCCFAQDDAMRCK